MQLGYPEFVAEVYPRAYYGKGRGKIWLAGVFCGYFDYESRLSECLNNGWGHHNCSHSEDVGVRCRSTSAISSVSDASASSPDTDTVIDKIMIIPVVAVAVSFTLLIVRRCRHRTRRSRSSVRYRRLPQSETIEMTEYEASSVVMATRESDYSITFSSLYPTQPVNYALSSKEEAKGPLQPTSSDALPPFGPLNPQKADE